MNRVRHRLAPLIKPVLAAASLGLLLSGWAFATAPGGVPDDPYHQSLIWCAWGESETCQDSGTDEGYLVPGIVGEQTCFIRKPALSATCVYTLSESLQPSDGLQVYGIQKSLNLTMPYHRIMRAFVGVNAEESVLAIRLANAWIAAAMLAFALVVLTPALRRALALAWAVCLVPIGVFIIPSANPNSWTIVGVGCFWAFLFAWLTSIRLNTKRSWATLAGAVLSAALALLARSDGSLFLAISGVSVLILAAPTLRRYPRRALVLLLPIPVVIWGISLKVWPRLSRTWETFLAGQPDPTTATASTPHVNQWVNHLLELPTMVMGIVGGPQSGAPWPNQYYLGLGYLDTAIPTLTSIFCAAALVAVSFWGLSWVQPRKLLAAGFTLVALCGAIYVPIALMHFTGGNIQARYVLPLLLVLVGIVCWIEPWQATQLNRTQAALLVLAVASGNAVANLANIRRYTNGEAVPYFDLSLMEQWWWRAAAPPSLTVWTLASVAGLIAFALLVCLARQPNLEPREASTRA